jgi:pyruvate/oxaloacetate carboxyltransferase
MRHGESQEKGQEESQEEVILLALCQKASENFLARRLKFEDTARDLAGSVVSGARYRGATR